MIFAELPKAVPFLFVLNRIEKKGIDKRMAQVYNTL